MPLLDVVFLLLTFFAFAMLLMVRAEVLGVELPVLEAGPEARTDAAPPAVVTIAADGSLAFNGEALPDDEVMARLIAERSSAPELALVLEVDTGAPSGRLIRLVQQLRAEGFTSLGILGQPADP